MVIRLQINGIEYRCTPIKKGEVLEENTLSEKLMQFEEGMRSYEAETYISPFYKYLVNNTQIIVSRVAAVLEIDKLSVRSIIQLAERCGLLYTGHNSTYKVTQEEKSNILNVLNERGEA